MDGQKRSSQPLLIRNYESPFVLAYRYPEFPAKEILASVFGVVAQNQLKRELTSELCRLPSEDIPPLDRYLVRQFRYFLLPLARTPLWELSAYR